MKSVWPWAVREREPPPPKPREFIETKEAGPLDAKENEAQFGKKVVDAIAEICLDRYRVGLKCEILTMRSYQYVAACMHWSTLRDRTYLIGAGLDRQAPLYYVEPVHGSIMMIRIDDKNGLSVREARPEDAPQQRHRSEDDPERSPIPDDSEHRIGG